MESPHNLEVPLPHMRGFMRVMLLLLALAAPISAAHARTPGGGGLPDSTATAAVKTAARASGLRLVVLERALDAYRRATDLGAVKRAVLTVIDYTLPSREPRLWVLDLAHGRVLARTLVAHGRGSGDSVATRFSNRANSFASSLGAFVTGDVYRGAHGLSLRLDGIDAGVNDRAKARGIVVHGAWYVSQALVKQFGRIGRSEGCPALSPAAAKRIIPMIDSGAVLFAYHAAETPEDEPGFGH